MRRSLPQATLAATDLVGTLLMVVVVVALGSVLAVVVSATLSTPPAAIGTYAMSPVAPGDASVTVRYQNGEPMPLTDLKILLARGDAAGLEIPSAAWTTPHPATLRAGDSLGLTLSPIAAADEQVRVTLVHIPSNAALAHLTQRVAVPGATLGAATLSATLTPNGIAADAVSPTLLEVRVSHPLGALAVASVQADLTTIYAAAKASPVVIDLNDVGRDGDALGGDGIWSATLRAPPTTPVGLYVVTINATDASGGAAGALSASVLVEPPLHGKRLGEGARFMVPTSQNMTSLRLRNWSFDTLHPERVESDAVGIRISNGTQSWSAHITLDICGPVNGIPCATSIRIWHGAAETTYNAVGVQALSTLDLNLLNPTLGGGWARASGSAHPLALYPAAGVGGNATFSIVALRDTTSPANADKAYETGIFGVDLVIR